MRHPDDSRKQAQTSQGLVLTDPYSVTGNAWEYEECPRDRDSKRDRRAAVPDRTRRRVDDDDQNSGRPRGMTVRVLAPPRGGAAEQCAPIPRLVGLALRAAMRLLLLL